MPNDVPRAGLARYAAAPGLQVKQWDTAQAVVFHPATNSTHLVDSLAGSVLQSLLRGDALNVLPNDTTERAKLDDTLLALSQVGLIRFTD